MAKLLRLSVSPHIHSGRSTAGIMRDVIIALMPAAIAGTVIFGLRALLVMGVCVASCVIFEALFNIITKKDQTIGDLSAALTGLLLAFNLPAQIPIWQCVVGSAFAIIIVKCLFGGIGCNLVNPAITARVFMIVAFSSMVSQTYPVIVDTVASATPLGEIAAGGMPEIKDLFLGLCGGAIGETCSLALLIGLVYLLVRRVISWHIPVSFIATVGLYAQVSLTGEVTIGITQTVSHTAGFSYKDDSGLSFIYEKKNSVAIKNLYPVVPERGGFYGFS